MRNIQLSLEIKKLYQLKQFGYKFTSTTTPENKKTTLTLPDDFKSLEKQANSCHLCELSKSRTKVLFGSGNPKADLMFVGISPNASDDMAGDLFTGRVGEMLNDMIEKVIGVSTTSVYLTNVVKCYPPQNRAVTTSEANTCISYLDAQIRLISPKIIVLLGDEAYKYMIGDSQQIAKIHGNVIKKDNTTLIPTFHPGFLFKNPSFKREALEDLLKVKSLLS